MDSLQKRNIPHLIYREATTWKSVFSVWKNQEGVREEWHRVAEEKGFASWSDWRGAAAQKINADKRKWDRFEVLSPNQSIPKFLIGPTKTWQAHFSENEKNIHNFKTLVSRISYQNNEKIQAIKHNFPTKTEFIGVVLENNVIVLLEGHHRATAVALAQKEKKPINFVNNPTIALTPISKDEEKLFKNILSIKPVT